MPTKIEWVRDAHGNQGESWNPIRARNRETGGVGHFCVHASPGCANCYAERMQPRFKNRVRYAAQDARKVEMYLDEDVLRQPLRWQNPRTVFVCSMTDLFFERVPEEWIDRIFAVMALAPQHTFQVLTKRSERMLDYMTSIENDTRGGDGRLRDCPGYAGGWRGALIEGTAQRIWMDRNPEGEDPGLWLAVHLPLPNVWLGVSVENQEWANIRIPHLMETPAAVRFLSVEPMLGPVNVDAALWSLNPWTHPLRVDWVICGGESGPDARPMHPDWPRRLRDECQASGVPFFFKQHGEWIDVDGPRLISTLPTWLPGDMWMSPDGALDPYRPAALTTHHSVYRDSLMRRVGKKRAGRKLDGRTWEEMPA